MDAAMKPAVVLALSVFARANVSGMLSSPATNAGRRIVKGCAPKTPTDIQTSNV